MTSVQAKPDGYYEALAALQAVGFTMVELDLYLCTHPHDAEAVAQYARTAKQYQDMTKRFEERYGPITHSGVSGSAPFGWSVTPWPWEV